MIRNKVQQTTVPLKNKNERKQSILFPETLLKGSEVKTKLDEKWRNQQSKRKRSWKAGWYSKKVVGTRKAFKKQVKAKGSTKEKADP